MVTQQTRILAEVQLAQFIHNLEDLSNDDQKEILYQVALTNPKYAARCTDILRIRNQISAQVQ